MTIEAEIERALQNVEIAFSKLNIEAWLNCFHPTRIIVLPTMVLSPDTVEDCEKSLGAYIENLRSQGYNRSELTQLKVRPLTETTAIAHTVWARFCDQTLIESIGATYLFVKTDEQWQIAMVTPHPENA